jgi:hypothetical protein
MSFKQDEKLVKAFRDRWRAVEAVEAFEQQTASIELRWQQLNAILWMAVALGLPTTESNDDDIIVYKRWAKLRNLLK